MGSWTGRLLNDLGSKMVTVMDHTGAIYAKDGLDCVKLSKHVKETGGVTGFAGAEAITEDEFYGMEVDVFIPAALEQMVDEEKAKLVNCKVLRGGCECSDDASG